MSKIIIKENSVVFNYETKESSFFECDNRELENELDYRFVIDYLKNYAANGIDIIIGAEEIGYIKYTTHTPFDCGCGFDIVKYTDDAHEKTEVSACGCCVKRYCEKARNIMAADLRDIVKELQDSTDWVLVFTDVENAAMCELNDTIEKAKETINNAEVSIKEHFDIDHIFELSEQVYNSIVNAKAAANNFIKKMSDFTGCGFTMADAYAETPAINTTCLIADVDTDMDVEDIFREWLGKIFGDNYYTIENLYNAIAA